ncbi:hypothetical protein BDZ97DRAFT_1789649 [Flammula alnicola]|nr:hypothetical protein BDZ97DRAFT_1789649 [Flammula alnicola]
MRLGLWIICIWRLALRQILMYGSIANWQVSLLPSPLFPYRSHRILEFAGRKKQLSAISSHGSGSCSYRPQQTQCQAL